ncbi:MAG: hypothetical protein GYB68_01105, partial [Chloroflexi bacterium]|nr:hypothetical protein [Chloroflexota bacterium]
MIISRRNQYRGINAHLQALLQTWPYRSDWQDFATGYLAELRDILATDVAPLGYDVRIERSLQIDDDLSGTLVIPDPLKDLTPGSSLSNVSVMGTQQPIPRAIFTEEEGTAFSALSLRHPRRDRPLVWIELLALASKPGGPYAQAYLDKRRLLLTTSLLVYIELDFNPGGSPTAHSLPDYSRDDPGSHAFGIIIADARGGRQDFEAAAVGFDVDQPIPAVTVLLLGDEQVTCAFDQAYQS